MYLWGMLFFMLFRLLLLALNISSGVISFSDLSLLPISFVYGFRFDTSVSCYILALPFIISSLGFFFKPIRKIFFHFSFYLLLAFYFAAYFICCADIPYFMQFSSRLSTAAFLWIGTPGFVIKMIVGTFSYWIFFVLFVLVCFRFYQVAAREKKKVVTDFESHTQLFFLKSLLFLILFAPILFLGMRGRIAEKSPMVTGTAYFSENNFLNQLGLNGAFTFISSAAEDLENGNQHMSLMDDEMAVENARKYLKIDSEYDSPIARKVVAAGKEKKMNVVLVIMEGMSSFNMGKYGGRDTVTPVLTALSKKGLYFENIFSQGIHTFNGIYSSLFSYPSLLHKHSMRNIPAKQYYSMPLVLKKNNYETRFFITHDGQFDNAQGFLTANGFDRVYAESDYPKGKVLSTLGVPDDYLFDFSISKLNEIAATGKNFFAGYMTGSNHNPIIIPDWVTEKFSSGEDHIRIIQYSDWAIGEFLKNCSKQDWYNNTIFVFVSDHGANWLHTYDMPLGFHHVPLIMYAPGLQLEPKSIYNPGGQLDIFPTVMGLMNMSYLNSTMGIDLLKEERPYIYFTAGNKIGCLDKEYYFIHRKDGGESLYKYEALDPTNLLEKFPAKADSMRNYAFSMLQATQWLVEHQKFKKQD